MEGSSIAAPVPEKDPVNIPDFPTHNLNEESLVFIINHVFLPPKLPANSDCTPENEASLIRVFKDCAETFARRLERQGNSRRAWDVVTRMLASAALLHGRGSVEGDELHKRIANMTAGDVVPVYVAAQNAAIMLRQPRDDHTILTLESFEVYPPASVVTHTEGKLRITYPSVGRLSVPVNPHVHESLSQFVSFYARNSIPDAQADKNIRTQNTQDPPSPKYITELLTGIVRAMSEKPDTMLAQTIYVSKRIDDHVLCDRYSKAPWRRSPLWLIIRVALQTTLREWNVEERASYKAFMLYALSSILRTALQLCHADHLLFVMNAKLARRFCKMPCESRDGCFARDCAAAVNKRVADELETRWKAIQKRTTREVEWPVPTKEEIIDGARIDLLTTVPHLKEIERRGVSQSPAGFIKNFVVPGGDQYTARYNADLVSPPNLKIIPSAPLERSLCLYDFEQWVARHNSNSFSGIDMLELTSALNDYIKTALSHYKGDPERLSVALLIMVELWIGIDKKAIEWEPYLKEYTPEIPGDTLEPLLLHRRDQMQRLSHIEIYLQNRHSVAQRQSAIFYDSKDSGSFANWFVNQSQPLRDTLQEIKEKAERAEKAKLAEMKYMNERYRDLKQKINAAVCTCRSGGGQTEYRFCNKCQYEYGLKPLRLTSFERPLPDDPVTVNCVVFELRLPRQFALWRDATAAVLSACSGGITGRTKGEPMLLSRYSGYNKWFSSAYPGRQLELAAYRTWYDYRYRPPISPQDIIKPHPMDKYRVLNDGTWACNPFSSLDREASLRNLRNLVTMKIDPEGPYHSLQSAVSSTNFTSNDVIASQETCSESITLHDYEAFGHVRTGHKLQWRNMLRELRRGILNISHQDVYLLFLQAMWQAGPRSKGNEWRRESHLDAAEAEFGEEAIQEMDAVLDGIEDSRTWACACGVLITMAARLLSLTDEPRVRDAAIGHLNRVRGVVRKWIKEITRAAERTDATIDVAEEGGDGPVERARQALLVAIMGCSTFDVDDEHIDRVFQSAQDVSFLVECRNIICMNKPPVLDTLPFSLRILYHRDEVFAIRFLPRLSAIISGLPGGKSGIDEGIKSIWHSYMPTGIWEEYGPHTRWYSTKTAAVDGSTSLEVHFNLLDGALYVDHKMVGKLPDEYTEHATYLQLFGGSRVLEVGPSDMPNMDYQTKRPVCGWQVHLKLDGSDLVVRSRRDDEVFELIPDSELASVLPRSLIHHHFHWYNTKSHIVEVRPYSGRWAPNLEKNWSTAFQLNGGPALSRQQESGVRQYLIDPGHALSRAMHNVFSPLEPNIFDLFMTFDSTDCNTQPLSISLSRYNLDFSVTEHGELSCLSHRSFIVDRDEDIGALYGLSNKLVLYRPSEIRKERKLIVPIGAIMSSSNGANHPMVSINVASNALSVKYRAYEVDELLGRLRETAFSDRLSLLYLHALTSHQLVDPLTKRTGTEEALEGLKRASSFSFQSLGGEDIQLLQCLGQLTPHRSLYSQQTRTMETVQRNIILPPTLEHHDFDGAAQRILSHWENIRALLPESQGKAQESDEEILSGIETEEHRQLTRRAATRNLFYAPSESDSSNSRGMDSEYPRESTGRSDSVHREALTYGMAKLVQEWPTNLDVTSQLLKDVKRWERVAARQAGLTLDYSVVWTESSLRTVWRSLYDLCRAAKKDRDQTKLTFLLATLSYCFPDEHRLHTTLLAFAIHPQFARLASPDSEKLDFTYGDALVKSQLRSYLTRNAVGFSRSSERAELDRLGWTSRRQTTLRWRYDSRLQQQIDECVTTLFQLRYQDHVSSSVLDHFDLVEKEHLMSYLSNTLKHCHENRAFFEHLQSLQTELNRIRGPAFDRPLCAWTLPSFEISQERCPFVTWSTLLSRATPCTPTPVEQLLEDCFDGMVEIRDSPLQQQYRSLLETSNVAYMERRQIPGTSSVDVKEEYRHASTTLHRIQDRIIELLGASSEKDVMLARAGLWPRISPMDILDTLTISRRSILSESWQEAFIEYAEAFTMVQRAIRISRFTKPEYRAELERELSNTGRVGWDSMSHPDWLLIELESNLLVRQVQADIASEMLAPSSEMNAVIQLNMGEGKSSVIVPIVSAALADRSQIVRVIVLKPLARQMFHLLCRTLSGLTNRRIFYIPIDRSLQPGPAWSKIQDLFVECMITRGILLCQPEHILSFKLMALETLSGSPSSSLSKSLLYTQKWLEENARDILDESDEILSPKYQLVYTIGTQHAPDGESMRWKLTQEVFDLVKVHARDERYEGALSIEGSYPQRFPQIRVFAQDCGQSLLYRVAEVIVFENALPSFSFRRLFPEDRAILFKFITEPVIGSDLYDKVTNICQNQDHSAPDNLAILKPVLLLRGLLGHGVLLIVLKEKRWRVDYGLDVSRSMLAVPYRAKDCPSPRAEFGHTDIAICLTCLTYYYEGLTDAQLGDCFEQLFKTDNPNQEYEEWIKDCRAALPKTLHRLRGLNLEDSVQRNEHIFTQLRHCKAVIDFFLSTIVFPKHMKEFPHKLSTSGWDLAQDRSSFGQLVTGFSGTNDNRFLLPQMIEQLDLEEHIHTNAMTLGYLLQEENSKVIHLPDAAKNICGMIEHLRDEEPNVRVMLDVGAQVLELQNREVAELWLKVDRRSEIEAAVFVDSKDDLRVLRRDGVVEMLVSSPYFEQLGRCVVYLDEAHTRGTDLKLPPGSRAAVTLGPRLCKDKLMQGCMRMRKLGSTHSVCFLASTEVANYITEATGVVGDQIMSKHVLKWTIRETIAQLRTYTPLWAHQGIGFDERNRAWKRFKKGSVSAAEFVDILREKESYPLQELYGVNQNATTSTQGSYLKTWIQDRCKEYGVGSTHEARMQEEREREVSQETEEERQNEKPPRAEPSTHSLHEDVRTLVLTGLIPRDVEGIISVPQCLSQTTLELGLGTTVFSHIWVTQDFARTIHTTVGHGSGTNKLDDFLRPTQWVLSSRKQPHLVLLSPFEANALIDQVRESSSVTLHVYAPRTSRSMRSFEDLRSFMIPQRDSTPVIPSNIINELNLFAGQLYLASRTAYEETCQMLGLYLKEPPENVALPPNAIDATGFVSSPSARQTLGLQDVQFADNPIAFLRKLTGLRRKGQGFLPTHLGRMLHAREIPDDEF